MKFCPNCGHQIEDDMKFCQKCGLRMPDETSSVKTGDHPPAPVNDNPPPESPKKKRKGMKVLAIICFVSAALYALIAIADTSILAMTAFMIIIGFMFLTLSGTEKGSKTFYPGKKTNGKPLKKSTYIVVCLIAAFVIFAILISALGGDTSSAKAGAPSSKAGTAVTSVSLSESVLTLNAGETHKLTYAAEPENADTAALSWSSSDRDVADVDIDGLVTAVKHGEATITVSDGKGIESHCTVTVPYVRPTAISFTESSRSIIYVDAPLTVDLAEELSAEPQNADLENLVWTSSNEKIATVEDGVITGIKTGKVTITVKTEDGLEAAKGYQIFSVTPESVSIKEPDIELTVGETYQLKPTVEPKGAETEYTYSGPDVDENGLITAQTAGTSTVTITTSNGKSAECTVVVKKQSPITIRAMKYTIDYVGGVEWTFKIRNNTDKEIKYVVLRWNCYNGVGDSIKDEITGKSSVGLRYTGPLGANKTTPTQRNTTLFYNSTFKKMTFTEISVEYMDGTTENITDDEYAGWSD